MRKHLSLTLMGACLMASATTVAQETTPKSAYVDVQKELKMEPFGTVVNEARTFRTAARKAPRRAAALTFTPNWKTQFDTEDEFNWFTVIDGDGNRYETDYGQVQNAWSYRDDSHCAWYNCWSTVTDDWLVTPGLNLRADKKYTLHFKTTTMNNNFPAEMDVMLGQQATADALTTPLEEGVVTNGYGYAETTVDFSPASDGVYYIGFHLTKVNYLLSFYLDDVSVETTPLEKAPAAVSDFNVTPDATGALKGEISFTLPTKACDGSNLTDLTGVKIRNGEFEIIDLKRVKPGQTVTYAINDIEEAGYQTYTVIPYNDVDEGEGTTVTAYIGLDTPTTPQNLELVDDEDHITVNWDASVAAHDGVFFPEEVTYTLYHIARNEYYQEVVGDAVASVKGENTMSLNVPTNQGEQFLKDFLINAENEAGPSNNYYRCYPILLGAPYAAPFTDTFDDGYSDKFWMQGAYKSGYSSSGVNSWSYDGFDSKLGCIALSAQNANDSVYLCSGKISLAGTKAPKLVYKLKNNAWVGSFYTFVKLPSGKIINLDKQELADDELKGEWVTRKYDLSDYADERFIQVGFSMMTDVREYGANRVLVDHITVGDVPQVDLAAELTAPKSIEKGQSTTLTVRVNNLGDSDVDGFRLKVTAGDKVLTNFLRQKQLKSMEYAIVDVTYDTDLLDQNETALVKAEVIAEGDGNADNNTAEATVTLKDPSYAPVSDLTLTNQETENGTDVTLAWKEAPAIVNKTDDFESYNAWATYETWNPTGVGEWTMIDGDGGYCWGFSDTWYYSERSAFAFTVFNPYNYDGYGTDFFSLIAEDAAAPFIPHSGEQYLAAIYSGQVVYNAETGQYEATIEDADNWLISPEQDGREQEITFYVNNYAGLAANGKVIDHVETYEVLYSTTDTEPESFTVIGGDRQATGGKWQEVKVQLPEGTKFFAIHHKSAYNAETDSPFIFMVDDISVQIDNQEVSSYRVYRDGSIIAETTSPSFTDKNVDEGEHTYQVTVVYASGDESAPVSETVVLSGIRNVTVDAQQDVIYDLQGRKLTTKSASTLPKGIYIMRSAEGRLQGKNGKKVAIK